MLNIAFQITAPIIDWLLRGLANMMDMTMIRTTASTTDIQLRQHPRDLFDVKLLLENEGFTDELKRGVIFGLVSSNRPTHEMLTPNMLDQRLAFESHFRLYGGNF